MVRGAEASSDEILGGTPLAPRPLHLPPRSGHADLPSPSHSHQQPGGDDGSKRREEYQVQDGLEIPAHGRQGSTARARAVAHATGDGIVLRWT